jgi:uncharacterized OB-fold protein
VLVQSPIPEATDREFWEACNEERLVIQNCAACDRLQHPPREACAACGSSEYLKWKPVSGRGRIYSYATVYHSPASWAEESHNFALIALEEDPGILMPSRLPGTPVDDVPIEAPVEVTFQTTAATGQKVPEWRVVGQPPSLSTSWSERHEPSVGRSGAVAPGLVGP